MRRARGTLVEVLAPVHADYSEESIRRRAAQAIPTFAEDLLDAMAVWTTIENSAKSEFPARPTNISTN